MTPDTFLNIVGVVLSVISFAAGLSKKWQSIAAISSCALICLSGYFLLLRSAHQHEISQAETEIHQIVKNNVQLTAEQILSQMRKPEYTVFHEALFRAVANGTIHDQMTSCLQNNGSRLDTRVYFP